MVKEIKKDNAVYFECGECRLLYKEKMWAMKCEEWCSKNKSCNLEIIKNSIKEGGSR